MTFSICVHEPYMADDGTDQHRFGVAVTTRLPGVGTLCPFVSPNGAVATQSLVNVDLGRDGISLIDDGIAVEDALPALLNADDGAANRQLHGVDTSGSFTFSGDDCMAWYGHTSGEHYTVAGNLLVGEAVIERTAEAYERTREADDPLAKRLIEALAAGQAEGGDKRTDLRVQSAAVRVATTESLEYRLPYNDLRVDADDEPIDRLRRVYELAVEGHEASHAKYEADQEPSSPAE